MIPLFLSPCCDGVYGQQNRTGELIELMSFSRSSLVQNPVRLSVYLVEISVNEDIRSTGRRSTGVFCQPGRFLFCQDQHTSLLGPGKTASRG
jgi:hypothetical protein